MIRRIEVEGLGPHRRLVADLSPDAVTVISGPSEIGKSTVLEAILLALLGRSSGGRFAPELIHDDASRATIRLQLDTGSTISRTFTRTRAQTRTITRQGREKTHSSEARFAKALGPLVADAEATRIVITPLAWQPMVAANARPFRDLLVRILPPADTGEVVREMMAALSLTVSDAEAAWSEKAVTTARRAVRRQRDSAAGQLQALTAQLERMTAQTAASIPAPAVAQQVVAAAEAWARWAQRSPEAHQHALDAQRAHDRQRAALGPAPAVPASLAVAQAAEDAAAEALQSATEDYRRARQRRDALAEQCAKLTDPDRCPTCGRGGWQEGAAVAADAQRGLAAAEAALEVATAAGRAARQAHRAAQQQREDVQQAVTQRAAWEAAIAALGARPPAPESPAPRPDVPRPSPAEVAAARQALQDWQAAEGARRQRQSDIRAMRDDQQRAQAALDVHQAEAARLDALVAAVREAPSRVLARQSQALGDMGPVSLVFGDNPAVMVMIDDRPWWLASRGRQVVADACLRAALRRVLGVPQLPVVIDNVQDVGGQPLPDIDGPVIILRTTDAPGLRIERTSHVHSPRP